METFLSPCVHNLITSVGMIENGEFHTDRHSSEFFNSDGTLNQSKLDEILPDPTETAEYFLECTQQLAEVFLQAERVLSRLDAEAYGKQYDQLNAVLGSAKICRDVHALLKSDNASEDILALLLITATIESSLSYIYSCHTSKPSPSLLKDLLSASELEDILGSVFIKVLKVLIGPPISLNLRNIAWHGFLVPGEIPKRYIYFLLLLYSSIGFLSNVNNLQLQGHREKHTFLCSSEYEEILEGVPFDVSAVLALLHNSGIFGVQYDAIEQAMKYYSSGLYGFAVTLVLPQFEHSLRRVFSEINKCPHRVMTAEATTLYTTFDEMLDPTLPSGDKNQLKEELGENFMDMIHDLLVYPDGPRVRDKLGHGEVDFYHFPEILVKAVLITVCAFVIHKSENSRQTNEDQKTFLTSLKDFTRNYESHFHPVSMVKKKLISVAVSFSTFIGSIQLSPDLELSTTNTIFFLEDHLGEVFQEMSLKVSEQCDKLFTTQGLNMPSKCEEVKAVLLSPMSNCRVILQEFLSQRLHTLYLYHKDVHNADGRSDDAALTNEPNVHEVVCLLQHIVDEIHTVIKQTTYTVTERQQQMLNRQLRSRQRDSLKKLINSCPFLHQSMLFVSVIVVWHLYNLKSKKINRAKTVKFLKMSLQFTENLRTYTNKDKNKWKECIDLYKNYLERTETFLTSVTKDK